MPGKRQMFRSSMVVGIFSFLGSLTGILVEVSIAAHLGLSRASDSFYVAFTIPYVITNLISATGQFSLVPFFSSLETHHSAEDLWHGLSYAANMVFICLAGVAGLGALTAPLIVRVIAPGFTAHQTELAAHLARWLFLIIIPAGVAETIRSFLLSKHRFAIPSSANFFRNSVVVASIILGFHRFGFYSIVFGYLAGYLVQFSVLAGQLLICFPVRYSLRLTGSGEAFRQLRGAGAAQLGTAVGWQGVVIVERIIASFLPPGSLTALAYGLKIMATTAELLAGSIGTAALPTLARSVARAIPAETFQVLRDTFEMSLALLAPALVFCLMLDRNIIRLVFQRGNFTPQATSVMAMVFSCYCLSLVPFSAIRLMNFYLFALHETSAFFRLMLFQYSLNIAFDLIYVGILRLGVIGIPLGMLTSLLLTCALVFRRDMGEIREVVNRPLAIFTAKIAAGAALAAAAVWAAQSWASRPQTGVQNFVYLLIVCGAGTLVFAAAMEVSGAFSIRSLASFGRHTEDA